MPHDQEAWWCETIGCSPTIVNSKADRTRDAVVIADAL
jgi:hypothetical protein